MATLKHGTVSAYTNGKCRCDLCKKAASESAKNRKKKPLAHDDPRHGTSNGYYNLGCRCVVCTKAAIDLNRERGYSRRGALKSNYGITPEEWESVFESQGGRCASCGDLPDENAKRRFHLDHNHSTGRNRGILCHGCNVGLGYLKEDRNKIRGLLAYLDKWETADS